MMELHEKRIKGRGYRQPKKSTQNTVYFYECPVLLILALYTLRSLFLAGT